MSFVNNSLSRRSFLIGMAAFSGTAPSLLSGFRANAAYRTSEAILPRNFGRGKSVAIVGAGVAGLTAAYKLASAGFKVSVFEADQRYGGRSLTARPTDNHYKDWWFKKYPQARAFPRMYADRYQERVDSPASELQVCEFMDEPWKNSGYQGNPVELFLNAGPGRIPSNHVNLIGLCKEIGVDLEPYIFHSMWNLMQSDLYNGGKPVSIGQVKYSLYGEMAHMMAKVIQEACQLSGDQKSDPRQLANLYELFGGLKRINPNDPCVLILDEMSSRLGYSDLPGGWKHVGKTKPSLKIKDILNSGFIGDAQENPELSPGSFLFNHFNIDWQPSLMQPIGGMDRIWQQLLVQDVESGALFYKRKVQGRNYKVGDLVFLGTEVNSISERKDRIYLKLSGGEGDYQWRDSWQAFDYCISTMSPSLLHGVLEPDNISSEFLEGLKTFAKTGRWDGELDGQSFKDPTSNHWTPAIKVGWQSQNRFWEINDNIYGGISWIDDIVGQVWYPSEDLTAHTGVLTGAYNRGGDAVIYSQQNIQQRLNTAIKSLSKLHPGEEDKIYFDKGLSISWQYMPYQSGGWASDTAMETPDLYSQITNFNPNGRFYCAGDTWSFWPGWQEGAVASVYCAISAIAKTIEPNNSKWHRSSCYGKES